MFVDTWSKIPARSLFNPDYLKQVDEARRSRRRQALIDQRQQMADDMFSARGVPPSVRQIIVQCAEEVGVEVYSMLVKDNRHFLAVARHKAMYLTKAQDMNRSSTRIGKWFGKDHTSILAGIARHARRTGLPPIGDYQIQERRRTALSEGTD